MIRIMQLFILVLMIISLILNVIINHKANQIKDAMETATCDAYAYDQELAPLHCNVFYLSK